MIQAQYISCVNDAGFVMNFSVRWLDQDGKWNTSSWNSGNYPIDQSRTSPDLASIGVPSDALAAAPYVHAILGGSETGTPYVQYAPNGVTATYEAKGTIFSYSVELIGPGAEGRAGASWPPRGEGRPRGPCGAEGRPGRWPGAPLSGNHSLVLHHPAGRPQEGQEPGHKRVRSRSCFPDPFDLPV